jgi:hypothetical protein
MIKMMKELHQSLRETTKFVWQAQEWWFFLHTCFTQRDNKGCGCAQEWREKELLRMQFAGRTLKKQHTCWCWLKKKGLEAVPGMQQLPKQSFPQPAACSSSWLMETKVATRLIVSMFAWLMDGFATTFCLWLAAPCVFLCRVGRRKDEDVELLAAVDRVCGWWVSVRERRRRGGRCSSACKSREVGWTAALGRWGAATTVQTRGADQTGVRAAFLWCGVTHKWSMAALQRRDAPPCLD